MIERKIIIGFITSSEFIREILPIWQERLIEGPEIRKIARWCIGYFKKYHCAPGKHIQSIFYEKIKEEKISPEIVDLMENELLPGLSEEYEDGINYKYLIDITKKLFRERALNQYSLQIQSLLEEGKLKEAEDLTGKFKIIQDEPENEIDLSSPDVLNKIKNIFNTISEPLISFPGALGELWNEHFIRGAFIALMGPEKRGKTFRLLQIALDAVRQKRKVAFFQAGDMTEIEQLERIVICLAQKSNHKKYCGTIYLPVKDCKFNQIDSCAKKEREGENGIWDMDELREMKDDIRSNVTFDKLKEKFEENPNYVPCYNCSEYSSNPWGVPWILKKEIKNPLDEKEAVKKMERFFIKNKRRIKLSTHANGTLKISDIERIIETWIKRDNFVPDVIIVDYADLLESSNKEFRHKQDEIWRGLRKISQLYHCLVVTATQSDADSYERNTLKLSNFSEDKRKYAHVTAMFGLNQDKEGREEELNIIRINSLIQRKGKKSSACVYVLQSLQTGQPYISSYW